jgi:hypothetical protein
MRFPSAVGRMHGLVVSFLIAACGGGGVASPSAAQPTNPIEPTPPPATGRSSISLDGKLLYDRTTAGDVHSIYVLEKGVEKPITDPGAYERSGISPDFKTLLVIPGGEGPQPIGGGILNIDGTGYRAIPSHDETLNLIP